VTDERNIAHDKTVAIVAHASSANHG